MFNRLTTVINHLINYNCLTNVYGLARSLLAIGLFLTLAINPIDGILTDFSNAYVVSSSFIDISLFHILSEQPIAAKIISLGILFLVIIGWRPRVTVILHWWIAYSFFISCPIIDGGDQISAIICFLLIPFGLADKRKWHWSKVPWVENNYLKIINYSFYMALRVQASIIYFFAAAEKLQVSEWKDGTVIYYWFTHPTFGANDFIGYFLNPLIQSPFVGLLTWGVIILEVVLAMAIFIDKKYWVYLLKAGIAFHFSIIIVHGLVSFFFAMSALLILYLRPLNQSFNLEYFSHIKNKFYRSIKFK